MLATRLSQLDPILGLDIKAMAIHVLACELVTNLEISMLPRQLSAP